MPIPIKNIYYLLCYAWDKLELKDLVEVDKEDFKELCDLFAKILINGTTHLFKRGLDKGYRRFEEETRSLRGKLLVANSLQRMLLEQAKAACAFDELTYSVLHNQILKTTLRRLLKTQELDPSLKSDLEVLYRRFPQVDEIKLESRHFSQVQLTRNNKYYGFLMDVCLIVHEQWLATEGGGAFTFQDFVRDEKRMGALFESFVFNFYEKEAKNLRVRSQDIHWEIEKSGPDDAYLPKMQTDVCLEDDRMQLKFVLETKFKQEVLQRHWDTEKVHSANLYQLYAYLRNIEANGGLDTNCTGILLYAASEKHPNWSFNFPRHEVRVVALDLAQEWRGIESDLLRMVNCPEQHLS